MWHRVQGWDVLESRETLPPELATAPPARVQHAGWRICVSMPKPWHDVATHTLVASVRYDQRTDTVYEEWTQVARSVYEINGDMAKLARIKKLPLEDQVAELIKLREIKQ